MALGAQPAQVLQLIVKQALTLMLWGTVVGLIGSIIATRFLSSLLYQTQPFDWAVFGTMASVLLAAGLLAAYIPARRAALIDPLLSLRQE